MKKLQETKHPLENDKIIKNVFTGQINYENRILKNIGGEILMILV